MLSEDITWCGRECNVTECRRNQVHIKLLIPHSFADLKDSEECYQKHKTEDNRYSTK